MFPVIDLGPFAIQAPGLILIISLFLGIWLTGRLAISLGTNGEAIENSLLIGLIAGILGARIGFLLQNPGIFIENPLSLVSLTPTMLNTSFGILVGSLTGYSTAQKNHLPLWPTLDTLSPLILLLFLGIHLANFASGNIYGLPTTLPWGVQLWGTLRHPVQLYALVLGLAVSIWFWLQTKGLTTNGFLRSGRLVLTLSGIMAGITIFTRAFVAEKITFWRFDSIQLSAFVILAIILGSIYHKFTQPQKKSRSIIGMGSNHQPQEHLTQGIKQLTERLTVKRASSVYRTKDVRDQKPSSFLNQIVEIETTKAYPALRESLKAIEGELGRETVEKDIIPLDLDILTYDEDVFVYEGHQIPDPDLIQYRYIAEPLAEIAPGFRHPANGKSIQEILKQIQDEKQVEKIKKVENGIKG